MHFCHADDIWRDYPELVPGVLFAQGIRPDAVVGAQVAFFGNRGFTFGHSGEVLPAWIKFQGTAIVGALLGMLIVGVAVNLGLHYLLGQLIATLASLVLTFAINRAWTFKH